MINPNQKVSVRVGSLGRDQWLSAALSNLTDGFIRAGCTCDPSWGQGPQELLLSRQLVNWTVVNFVTVGWWPNWATISNKGVNWTRTMEVQDLNVCRQAAEC